MLFPHVLSCRVVGSQQLFLAGLQLTSPLMAAVSQNMIPVFTFLLAAALGYARHILIPCDSLFLLLTRFLHVASIRFNCHEPQIDCCLTTHRLEEVNMRRREGVAKVIGTAVCIGGAVIMSVYKGIALFGGGGDTPDAGFTQPFANLGAFLHHDIVQFSVNKYHLGIFFLIMNCVSWGVYLTYQVHAQCPTSLIAPGILRSVYQD